MLSSLSRSSTIKKMSVLVLRIWDHNCRIEKYVVEHGLQTDEDADDVVDDCYNLQLAGQPVHGVRAAGERRGS